MFKSVCCNEILDLILFQLYRNWVHYSLKRRFKHGHNEQTEKCPKEPEERPRQGRENQQLGMRNRPSMEIMLSVDLFMNKAYILVLTTGLISCTFTKCLTIVFFSFVAQT